DLCLLLLSVRALRVDLGSLEANLHVEHRALGADRPCPVDRRGAVPLVLLGGLVQGPQVVVRRHVVVVPESLELVGHAPCCCGLRRRHAFSPEDCSVKLSILPPGRAAGGRMGDVADDTIYLEQMELGPMQNFVYLIGDPVARECGVVDAAWEIDTIVETAQARGMTITGALVTHTHQDHVGGSLASWGMPGRIPGVEDLLGRVKAKVYVHKAEREFLRGFGSDLVAVDNHATLAIGRLTLTFMHTPAHTPE